MRKLNNPTTTSFAGLFFSVIKIRKPFFVTMMIVFKFGNLL